MIPFLPTIPTSQRSGRAWLVPVLALAVLGGGLAWLAQGPLSGSRREGAAASPAHVGPGVDTSPQPPDREPRVVRQEEPERVARPAPVPTGEPAAGGDEAPRETSPYDAETMETMRRLTRGERDERIALARDVLAREDRGLLAIRALEVLIELSPKEAVERLHALNTNEPADLRTLRVTGSMVERLARREGVVSDDDLRAFYAHGAREVRIAAAGVLEERGDGSLMKAHLSECARTIESGNALERSTLLRELSLLRSPEAGRMVLGLLGDEDENVRHQAVLAVGRRPDDSDALEALRRLENDPSERVRTAARRTLSMMERVQAARERAASGRR